MKQRILFAALALLLLTACHKENPDPRMEITIEKLQGNGKLTLDGLTATWNDGDTIRLNGTPVVVERSGDHAYISNTAAPSTNRALFPTRLVASGPTSDSITVTLPREYDYRSDGTRQQLTLPLAARATDDNPLHFMHLTGALCFMLTNSTSHPLTIDRITVSSNAYQLSGERAINLGSIGSIGPNDGTGNDLTVAMTFTKQSLVIPASGNANVVLPIAPVGSDNRFTVTITCHYLGDRYVYTQTQGEGKIDRSLDRNEIGYAAMTLGNTFAEALFSGAGTSNTPYLITTPTDFITMVDAISQGWTNPYRTKYNTSYFRLSNNIDLNGISIYPIRNYNHATFDGNNYSIYNLTINSRGDTCALFCNPTYVTLSNLTLNNLTLKHNGNSSGYLLMGGFCGLTRGCSISDCHITGLTLSISGNISSATTYIGGITARAIKANTLTNCSVSISPTIDLTTASLFYGNIIGHCNEGENNDNDLSLTNCDATNTSLSIRTSGNLFFGGAVANIARELLTLNGCDYNGNGSLTSTGSYVTAGGFVGRFVNSLTPCNLTITNCTANGTITVSGTSNNLGTYYGTSNNGSYISINTGTCSVNGFGFN